MILADYGSCSLQVMGSWFNPWLQNIGAQYYHQRRIHVEQLCIYNVTLGTDRESRKRHQYIEFVFSLTLSAPLVGQERVTNPKKRLRGRLPVLIICHFNVSFPRA